MPRTWFLQRGSQYDPVPSEHDRYTHEQRAHSSEPEVLRIHIYNFSLKHTSFTEPDIVEAFRISCCALILWLIIELNFMFLQNFLIFFLIHFTGKTGRRRNNSYYNKNAAYERELRKEEYRKLLIRYRWVRRLWYFSAY